MSPRPQRPMLEPIADGVWSLQHPQRFWGVEVGTRMTVVRLTGGGLFVHCPVALDDALRRALDALGPVKVIAASSLFHHLYVMDFVRAYPDASVWGCPGLCDKRRDVPWSGTLGDGPEPAWTDDLDQAPFTARFEREIVFFHRRTRTFLCADALLHLSTHPSRVTRAVAFGMANTAPGKGWLERIAVRDHAIGKRQVERILEWDIEGVVLAHGALPDGDGRAIVEDAYDWLLR